MLAHVLQFCHCGRDILRAVITGTTFVDSLKTIRIEANINGMLFEIPWVDICSLIKARCTP